jgi:hypothetical protein
VSGFALNMTSAKSGQKYRYGYHRYEEEATAASSTRRRRREVSRL